MTSGISIPSFIERILIFFIPEKISDISSILCLLAVAKNIFKSSWLIILSCSSISFLIEFSAKSKSWFNSALVNVLSSPVPWTSINSPFLFIITFISTSAAESSEYFKSTIKLESILPTLIAATLEIKGFSSNISSCNNFFIASARAIYPPVIEVVLVPPSAWITSQSIVISLSPNFSKSIEALKALPINLWISTVLPVNFPLLASLGFLSFVALGSIEYSAVTQPFPVPLKNEGTLSLTEAVQMTFVFPTSIKTEPSA